MAFLAGLAVGFIVGAVTVIVLALVASDKSTQDTG
jgi:gas vesicle protein